MRSPLNNASSFGAILIVLFWILLAITFLLELSSCQRLLNPGAHRMDQILQSMAKFEEEFGVIPDVEISIGFLSPREDGFTRYASCNPNAMQPTLRMSPLVFDYGDSFVEWVTFHELGHCIYRLNHLNERFSMMRGSVDPWWMDNYEANRQQFLDHFRELVRGIEPVNVLDGGSLLDRESLSEWISTRIGTEGEL